MKNLKILVTGTNSGLGKFICERMPDVTRLNRENRVDIVGSDRKYDIIIMIIIYQVKFRFIFLAFLCLKKQMAQKLPRNVLRQQIQLQEYTMAMVPNNLINSAHVLLIR